MVKSIARTSYHRRRLVVATWIVFPIGISIVGSVAGGVFKNDFALPGSESSDAFDVLEERGFGDRAGFHGPDRV